MSNYPNMKLTNTGIDLIAESIAESKALIFTKVKLGDGLLAEGQSIAVLTDLISAKMNVPLSSGTAAAGQAKLRFAVENSGLNEGFWAREVGVFAKVGVDGEEALYAYSNGGNYVDFIPDKTRHMDAQIMDVYIVTGNASSVEIIVNSAAYALASDLIDHNTDNTAHPDIRTLIANSGLNILKRNHTYEVGDIAYSPLLKSWQRLECVNAGMTSSGDLDVTSSTTGGVIVDGTCTWLLTDVRDCTPVGAVRASLYLPLGYTKALGATVLRADYPRLVRLADEEELWTNDTANNPGLFGRGDGVTTFVLPNWSDRMVQLMAAGAGAAVAAGLPNIKGTAMFRYGTNSARIGLTVSGSISSQSKDYGNTYQPISLTGTTTMAQELDFDASQSNAIYGGSDTVQPPAIKMIPIIKY